MMTVWEAIVRTLRNKALKGDPKSIEFLIKQEPEVVRAVEATKQPKLGKDFSAKEALEAYRRMINYNGQPD